MTAGQLTAAGWAEPGRMSGDGQLAALLRFMRSLPADDAAGRVERGWAFLGGAIPGWWRAGSARPVDLATLDFGDGDRCLLAQLCPAGVHEASRKRDTAYTAHARVLSGLTRPADIDRWARVHGFYGQGDDIAALEDDLAALRWEWAGRITRARGDAA